MFQEYKQQTAPVIIKMNVKVSINNDYLKSQNNLRNLCKSNLI